MNNTITKDTLFTAKPDKPLTKAEMTVQASREIIEAETKEREAKTQRLRQARLEREAQQPKPEPTKTRAKKAPARKIRRGGN